MYYFLLKNNHPYYHREDFAGETAMPSKKSQKPNLESALSRIQTMAETPRETPLERFILEHFDALVALKSQGYTVPDIAKVLKEEGFAAAPPTVHAALNRAANLLGKPNPYRRSNTDNDLSASNGAPNQVPNEATGLTIDRPLPEPTKKQQPAY
jgi:hypothetical protein